MKIKTKILWTLLGMSLLVVLVGALAVNRLQAAAMASVTKEAQDVARRRQLSPHFRFKSTLRVRPGNRCQVASDTRAGGGADGFQSDRPGRRHFHHGSVNAFTENPGDEIGATIKDRQVRTFVEVSEQHPAGLKQIVVPVEGESGQVIGAVVLDIHRSTMN